MRCVAPVRAFQPVDGGQVIFAERGDVREISLRCGNCIGCRLSRTQEWSIRCMNEARMWEYNSFVTLTYSDEYLGSLSLNYTDFQKFMKRLRFTGRKVRFFMCGEYGALNWRPHFHAILFNCDFPDRVIHRASIDGEHLYRSAELERLWPYGFASIGSVTQQSAQYVAGYVVKKVNGDAAADHYQVVDERTGELCPVVPEFGHMSLKPGIGSTFYDKFGADVRVGDCSVVSGVKYRPPRYYDRKLETLSPDDYEEVKYKRYLYSLKLLGDSTPSRLAAMEVVAKARFNLKKRDL